MYMYMLGNWRPICEWLVYPKNLFGPPPPQNKRGLTRWTQGLKHVHVHVYITGSKHRKTWSTVMTRVIPVHVSFIKIGTSLAYQHKAPVLPAMHLLRVGILWTPRPSKAEQGQCGLFPTPMAFVVNMFMLLSYSHCRLFV